MEDINIDKVGHVGLRRHFSGKTNERKAKNKTKTVKKEESKVTSRPGQSGIYISVRNGHLIPFLPKLTSKF